MELKGKPARRQRDRGVDWRLGRVSCGPLLEEKLSLPVSPLRALQRHDRKPWLAVLTHSRTAHIIVQ